MAARVLYLSVSPRTVVTMFSWTTRLAPTGTRTARSASCWTRAAGVSGAVEVLRVRRAVGREVERALVARALVERALVRLDEVVFWRRGVLALPPVLCVAITCVLRSSLGLSMISNTCL